MFSARWPVALPGLVVLCAIVLTAPPGATAQPSTKVGNTLRFGSGLLDVPVAGTLPHMSLVVAYSGFGVNIDAPPLTDPGGNIIGVAAQPFEKWLSDASVTVGLFDRVELGATFQNFADAVDGGRLLGAHGRIALIRPEVRGVGLAVGGRLVQSPSFTGTGRNDYRVSRLGHPDSRVFETYSGVNRDDVQTSFTPYVVATGMLRGWDVGSLPPYDVTLSAGWGAGQFRDGEDLPFYAFTDSEGFFAGSALHLLIADNRLLNLMGEWNGFDLNFGVQLDLGGVRVGGFVLGANYEREFSIYRSRKWGIQASVALCPREVNFCKPRLLDRVQPDTVQLPPPPPDTVMVERQFEPEPLPRGTPVELCLSTGRSQTVWVTPSGDTLVGPDRTSIRDLGPGFTLAGSYALGADWYESGEDLTFEERTYARTGTPRPNDCARILPVGVMEGVPVFTDRGADRPFQTLWIPERPGVWHAYQLGVRRTRGEER